MYNSDNSYYHNQPPATPSRIGKIPKTNNKSTHHNDNSFDYNKYYTPYPQGVDYHGHPPQSVDVAEQLDDNTAPPETEEVEHQFVLSTEVLEMFARTEKRRRERKRLSTQPQQSNGKPQRQNGKPQQREGQDTSLHTGRDKDRNFVASTYTHPSFHREPDESTKTYAIYGTDSKEAQKINTLESTLNMMFDNACDIKAPILWPAEPLKSW